jgi:hypothetical protein
MLFALLTRELALPHWVTAPQPPSFSELRDSVKLPKGLQYSNQERELHYELRISELGELPTREHCWHDAFNALMWQRWPHSKRALSALQAQDVRNLGKQRSRRQMALTHFDEAGVLVAGVSASMLAAWDAHQWPEFFAMWREQAPLLHVFGHALLEHAKVNAHQLLTAKSMVLECSIELPQSTLDQQLASVLHKLDDPQQLRPLPLSGIPQAWPLQDENFFNKAACFRPLRVGRKYPPPLSAELQSHS